ncbi:MAG: hypothetical protein K1X35_13790 [Caulobacteraceae bacterium]|nr:hypothetical protein [Caulobacteraceae bacterium]
MLELSGRLWDFDRTAALGTSIMDDRESPQGDPHGRILAPAWMNRRQRRRWREDLGYDPSAEHARFTHWTAWLAAAAFLASAARVAAAVWPL